MPLKKPLRSRIGKKPRMTPIRALRAKIWIEATLSLYDISLEEFSEHVSVDKEVGLKNVLSWMSGKNLPSENCKVAKISAKFPDGFFYYKFPVFELLEKEISRTTLNSLVGNYSLNLLIPTLNDSPAYKSSSLSMWNFPDTANNGVLKPIGKSFLNDYETLYQRGDIYGFIGILMLLRKAELDNDAPLHAELTMAAYRALPGFCRNEIFRKHWEEFYSALYSIQINMITSFRLIKPLKAVIESQIFAEDHITRRELLPLCPIDNRFLEAKKPYIDADFDNSATSNRQDMERDEEILRRLELLASLLEKFSKD